MLPTRETLQDAIAPRRTALLIIDVQNDFCHEDCKTMVPRLQGLISVARKAGVFVVYIQNVVLPTSMSDSPPEIARRRKFGMRSEVTVPGTWGYDIVEQVAPQPTDLVVCKHRMNAFLGTSLDRLLRNQGIETIVCTGMATHGCVMNTAYAALMQDYYVAVVKDCVAAFRRDLHDVALLLMDNTVHYLLESDQLKNLWKS